jgi:hypothetical protein
MGRLDRFRRLVRRCQSYVHVSSSHAIEKRRGCKAAPFFVHSPPEAKPLKYDGWMIIHRLGFDFVECEGFVIP